MKGILVSFGLVLSIILGQAVFAQQPFPDKVKAKIQSEIKDKIVKNRQINSFVSSTSDILGVWTGNIETVSNDGVYSENEVTLTILSQSDNGKLFYGNIDGDDVTGTFSWNAISGITADGTLISGYIFNSSWWGDYDWGSFDGGGSTWGDFDWSDYDWDEGKDFDWDNFDWGSYDWGDHENGDGDKDDNKSRIRLNKDEDGSDEEMTISIMIPGESTASGTLTK